jgi:hypothetical protein
MQRTITACLGWRIEAWEQASGSAASQDAKLVWPDPAGRFLRVAVLDGVTPSHGCRTVVGVDGAMYAAAIAHLALQHPERPLEQCVLAANRVLHDERLGRSRDQTQTCVTAADVHPDGRIDVVRAGDCEAWARTDRGWVALGSGSALSAHTEAAWDRWQRRNPAVDRSARHDAEERLLGRAEAWTSTALGRFASPVLRRFGAHGVHELVLASDGARLSEGVLDDLPAWLHGLRDWERARSVLGAAAGKLHDDVTVLRLRPRSAARPASFADAWEDRRAA